MRLAVIDLETTGLSSASDRIVEIAIVRTRGLVEEERWSSLVHSDVAVGSSARVHGISDAMLEGAPTLTSLRERVAELTNGATLVAHRAAFDVGFLEAAATRGELAPLDVGVIDTAAIADRAFGETGLLAIARRIAGRAPRHRALPDALAALDALAAAIDTLGPIDAAELVALSCTKASLRSEVEAVLRAGAQAGEQVGIVYRPASGRPQRDLLRVETVHPPYVTGVLQKKNVRRVLRGDRVVRAWIGDPPPMRFL